MPFGLYSASIDDFEHLAQSGFTLVGPWYDDDRLAERLDAAHAAGLGVIVSVGFDHGRFRQTKTIDWSEARTKKEITKRITSLADHPAVFAWYLVPEELRHWSEPDVAYLRWATEAIATADPKRRPVMTYQPNNRNAESLEPFAAVLDIVSKGSYVNHAGHQDERSWLRYSVEQCAKAASTVEPARAVWAVPEMFLEPSDPEHIDAWTRHDVYASLVSGATGVLVYSGFRRQGFPSYDAYRAGYEAVAGELNGPGGLGPAIVFGPECEGPRVDAVGAPLVRFRDGDRDVEVPAVAWRTTAYQDHWYGLIVSSATEPVEVEIEEVVGFEVVSGTPIRVEAPNRIVLGPLAAVVIRGLRA